MIHPIIAATSTIGYDRNYWEVFWIGFGFIAQLIFAARFLVQWIVSEKKGKSTIPIAFWYLSLIGGGMLLTYAIYRMDPVFIFGQATGFSIYCRNLYLIRKENKLDVESTK